VGRRDVNRGHAKTKETECIRGFGEPDGKTGGNDGIGCVGEVICIYPYVPLTNHSYMVSMEFHGGILWGRLFPATPALHLSRLTLFQVAT
jgi:hypothetical protein